MNAASTGRAAVRSWSRGWRAAAALSWRMLVVAVVTTAACESPRPAPAPSPRVVSLSPNTTETIFALGASSLLVGRSRHCDYPPEAAALPAVGGFADPSVEAIVALRPTLVVGARGPAGPGLAQSLGAHHIETYFPAIDSVAGIRAMIVGLGHQVDRPAQARKLAERVDQELASLRAAAAELPTVRVLLVFDASPVVVAGPGCFPSELLRLAGGKNVIDRGGPYPTVGIERLLALQPEVIIDATRAGTGAPASSDAPSPLASRPGWERLAAVREGRVRVLQSSTALRPGPRIAEGLAEIGRAVHDRELRP